MYFVSERLIYYLLTGQRKLLQTALLKRWFNQFLDCLTISSHQLTKMLGNKHKPATRGNLHSRLVPKDSDSFWKKCVALKRTVLEVSMSFNVYSYISTYERRFKRACEQIVQLNYSLDVLQQRYNKAKKDNHKSFRYSLRLRIAVLDGIFRLFLKKVCGSEKNRFRSFHELQCLLIHLDVCFTGNDVHYFSKQFLS
jgi:hypothetical protein